MTAVPAVSQEHSEFRTVFLGFLDARPYLRSAWSVCVSVNFFLLLGQSRLLGGKASGRIVGQRKYNFLTDKSVFLNDQCYNHGAPTDPLRCKNVTPLTRAPNWPPLVQKRYVSRHWHRPPTDLLWCKNVTSLTPGPNWPPLVQKRYVTDTGPQLTSFGAKTL